MAMLVVSNGFTIGAAMAGFIASYLIPNYGWRSVFYFGGTVPLVIGLMMFISLPESLQFLTLRKKSLDKVGRWLKRVEPSVTIGPGTTFVVNEEQKKGVPIVALFHEGRADGHAPAVDDAVHEPDESVFPVHLAPDDRARHGHGDDGGGDGGDDVPVAAARWERSRSAGRFRSAASSAC